jgi:type VI secretion system protein ImpA
LRTREVSDTVSLEKAVWEESLQVMKSSGMKQALGQLLAAASSAPSVRERNRYRLLMARLCLTAGKPDLARPIVEELHALIEELHLERWESPLWIAEVLDALYQCLTQGEPSDDDMIRAKALFQRLCVTDITKALPYKS